MQISEQIARSSGLGREQVEAVLRLLDEGATIPFIARYRKEQTGRLDEDRIREIEQIRARQISLNERRDSVRKLIEEKGMLDDTVKAALEKADTLAEVEDIYRPYREKRRTKATEAAAAGYGPLAEELLAQTHPVSGDEKALEGAGYIVAEKLSDDAALRQMIREFMEKTGTVESRKKKDAQDEKGTYEMYYDFSDPIRKIPGYRVLAMERGEKEKILTVSVTADTAEIERRVQSRVIRNDTNRPLLEAVIHDALNRLILPSIRREIRTSLRERSCEKAIRGFSVNLENILMTRPLRGKSVLAWDPGYAHGCKLAVLDRTGTLLTTDVIYPFKGQGGRDQAIRKTRLLLDRYQPDLVVIGNGTASRESERLVAEIIRDYPQVSYVIGSEAGASVYSASVLAREEFPDLAVELRSAVSIGRRVQDPLSELVKIDPQSLGIGEYQHDVPARQLKEALNFVTDKAVNRVGVNVNTGSPSLLLHVSGLTKAQIAKIIRNRPVSSRQDLAAILPARVYEQSVGFLRIPDGAQPLDATGIHPESYELALRLLDTVGLDLKDMRTEGFKETLKKINPVAIARQLSTGTDTMIDIIRELRNPGLDPRDSLDAPILKKDVLTIEDLAPGMELQGTVRNVTSFGAFVDIGLHDDGLVHISRMASHFVKDPGEIVRSGQIVTVWVNDIDRRRQRVGLSLIRPDHAQM